MALLTVTEPPPQLPEGRGRGMCALLIDPHAAALMRTADGGWVERTALAEQIDISGKALTARLGDLVAERLLHERVALADRRSSEYALSAAGQGALWLREEWLALADALGASAGERAELFARFLADRFDPAIVRQIAYGSRQFNELLRDSRTLAHNWGLQERLLHASGLGSRIERLEALGLLNRTLTPSRQAVASYSAGRQLWRLARPALCDALWWATHRPGSIPPMFGELLAVVQMIIDHVPTVPKAPEGTLLLHVSPGGWADVPLRLEAGRLWILRVPPIRPSVRVQAGIGAWAQALLCGSCETLEIDGEAAVAHAAIPALAVPLCR